ncbi:unnamed protein product [Arctia plantaginis]|uniref:Secreted protein n=1 Tax=Arctia plantaginis TaxID=874455 RepID=A0A8S0Z7V8_ARCPL|nr:unnamed protein product [Arctia plantaginis]
MSRLVVVACVLMFVAMAVCLDTPTNLKPNTEMPKDGQVHVPTGHPKHPNPQHKLDGQHQDAPRQDGGQMPKADKSDEKPPQDTKN